MLQTHRNIERQLRGKWRRNQRVRGRVEALLHHAHIDVRRYAVDRLYGPYLWLTEDGSLEFAWMEIDERGIECREWESWGGWERDCDDDDREACWTGA